MEEENIKAYVTKYALTDGILLVEGKPYYGIECIRINHNGLHSHMFFGKDWHRTPEAALIRAEEMRIKKIKSLQKSLKKMELLKFVIPLA